MLIFLKCKHNVYIYELFSKLIYEIDIHVDPDIDLKYLTGFDDIVNYSNTMFLDESLYLFIT